MDIPKVVKFPSDAELRNTITIRVTFYQITKDINAALFLSQLYYWSTRTKNLEKWIFKTVKDLQKEIFLTAYQQRRAREKLLHLGLIEEKCMGIPPKMYFRLRFDPQNGEENQDIQHEEINKLNINSEETSQMKVNKLAYNTEETSLMGIKKSDPDRQESSSNTIIDKITTKNTSETTTKIDDRSVGTVNKTINLEYEIFLHWKKVMNHPNAQMDDKRKKLIRNALKLGYSAESICQAISGCSITPHNIGDNDKGQRFDGLHIILKSADQIDRFIANYNSNPMKKTVSEKMAMQNRDVAERWLNAAEMKQL